MKRTLPLCLIAAIAALLLLPGLAFATVAPTSSATFLLQSQAAGKGRLLQLTGTAAALTSRSVWQGALAGGAQLACGSFTGGVAEPAVLVPVGKGGARLELFRLQPSGSYAPLTVWRAVKAGFTVAATRLTAADVNGDGRDELIVLVPFGKHGAEILGFSFTSSVATKHVLWKTLKAPFALKSAQLAATDLNGDGKVDLALFSHSGSVGHLYGFISSGAHLTLALRWQGGAAAATYLAAGPVAGSAKGTAFLLGRNSASRATLRSLTASGRGFTAGRAWSGALALGGAQLACTALGGDGSGDVLVLTSSSRAVRLTALLPAASGFSLSRCWQASGLAAASLRLSAAPSGARVLAPATTVLAGADTAPLTSVSADASTLTFSDAPAGAAPGKVLLIEPCAAAPDGLLRNVTAVSTSDGVTTVTTTPAALTQAFSSLDLSLSRQLTGDDLAGARLAPGVHLAGDGRLSDGSGSLPTFTLAIDHDFGPLDVTGSVTLAERVDMDASISALGLQSAYVASVATEDSTLTCTADAGWQDDGEVDLPLAAVPVDVGGVPMTIDIELALKAHGDFAVGIQTSVDQTASFTIGARYENGGFSAVSSPSVTASCTSPTLNGAADLKASIGPQVSIMVCGAAGPSVDVDGYGELTGDAAAVRPWWALHGGLEGSIDFNTQALSDTLADWSYSQTFYDHLFEQSPSSSEWAAVSTGDDYTLALKKNGTLWAWGANDVGQLGLGDTVQRDVPTEVGSASDWAAVAGAGGSNLALKTDGTLWAWGYNGSGELGLGGADNDAHPTPKQVGSASDWAAVSASEMCTLALKTDGTLWAWGGNYDGELGLGGVDDNAHPTPTEVGSASDWAAVSAGFDYALALKTDGTLWAWGANRYGKLGLGDATARDAPTQVASASDWAAVSASMYETLALKKDGTLWAWGLNNFGQLGLGAVDDNAHPSPTEVGTASDWAAVSSGGASTLALKNDGTLWAWGYNEKGELGVGDTTERDTPTQVGSASDWTAVSDCVDFTLAIKNDGTLWAWGFNDSGQLGIGGPDDYSAHPTPIKVGP